MDLYRIGTALSDKTFPGKLLRAPLRLIPGDLQVPILQGILKGRRWIVGSGTHSQWLGNYRLPMQTAFAKSVGPGSVVWDVGSHVGFFTLMASVLAGDEGRVVAFEPSRRNLAYLKKHVEINQLRNVTVIEAAVSDSHGSRAFDSGESSFSGSLSRAGEYVVSTVRLDDLYEAGTIPQPDVINMDIERAEVAALTGARKLIDDCRPTIFLETHSPEAHSGCLALLRGSGYAIELLDTAFYKIRRQQIVAMPTSRTKSHRDEIRT